MNKKLIFVYEPDGLSSARIKISRKQTDEIKTNSFDYLSIDEFLKSEYLEPDFIILEDEAEYQIQLIEASFEIEILRIIIVCDSLTAMQVVIEKVIEAPKIITLDYKIGSNKSPENIPLIYKRIRERFKSTAILGYTNFGRKKADKEFSAKSADELTQLLRSNGEAVIEKFGMNKPALSSILFDRIQVQNLRKALIITSTENMLLRSEIETNEDIFAEKIRAYKESNTLRHLERPLIGSSYAMKKIKYFIERYAKSDIEVLIYGEQGTGKELVARAIHRLSTSRCENKFTSVDCGSIPEGLFESELFGYEQGAHNKADKMKKGLIEESDKGTLFLDEIGNLDYISQTKILRALQEKKIRRLGGNEEIDVDFRLISATNKNIPELISQGKFHPDLHQRLMSYFPTAPSLKERKEDIPILISHFCTKTKVGFKLSPDAIEYMTNYTWDGNVRQLEKFIQNLGVLFDDETVTKREVEGILQTNTKSKTPKSISKQSRDCSNAETLLNEIHKIVLDKYNSQEKVSQEEIAKHFKSKTGKPRLSRKEFSEKYFSPHKDCIRQLISTQNNAWSETIQKCRFIRDLKSEM